MFFSYSSVALRDLHSFPTRRSSDLGVAHGCPSEFTAATRPCRIGRCESARSLCRIAPEAKCASGSAGYRSEEHTSELQSRFDLVCRLLLEKKNTLKQGYNLVDNIVH